MAFAATLMMALAPGLSAQDTGEDRGTETGPAPFRDFKFKRVAPPVPGATKRITVQVAPKGTQAPVEEPASPGAAHASSVDAYPWFWAALSPDLSASAPGRLFDALDVIEAEHAAPAPRLQTLQAIVDAHGPQMLGATVGTQVSPALVPAVISVESSGAPDALSSAGARGLMQLMPATAERFGVTDISNPAQNIRGGVTFLDHLMTLYGTDPVLVLAAYNAGEGAVASHGGVPSYAETRNYVPKVLSAYRVTRGLCLDPAAPPV